MKQERQRYKKERKKKRKKERKIRIKEECCKKLKQFLFISVAIDFLLISGFSDMEKIPKNLPNKK
jgi:hypothetical protein